MFKKSRLYQLDPYVDNGGILRIWGDLFDTYLSLKEKHPVVLPKELLSQNYHEDVHHQGFQIIQGALRQPCS